MSNYNFKEIEKKWQNKWDEAQIFIAKDFEANKKFYGLIEFPYPSGAGLHVGHPRSFTAMDVISRWKRMNGYNVLFPIGWDAFGLPTENYAIKTGRHPIDITKENTQIFIKQLKKLGYSFDWSREINTSSPEYYRWTQWIFLKLLEKGLAYKKKIPINWCPACKIGLANEEVIDGKCERCGQQTEQREMAQWILKITEYADKLIDGLADVDYLPEIKTLQTNWIGRSFGAEVDFKIKDFSEIITVFTTRPDTLFGVTYLVLSPENELVEKIVTAEQKEAVEKYKLESKKKNILERTEVSKDKTGIFTGAYAINPVNGKTIPIWVSDYVVATYGTGAVMAVPAHDERDFEFAKKYTLEIIPVINKTEGEYLVIEKSLPENLIPKLNFFGEVTIEKIDEEWGKFFRVVVFKGKEKEIEKFLKDNLLTDEKGDGNWYSDSMGSNNKVIFNNKVFEIFNNNDLQKFKEYGRQVGVPEDELDITFSEKCFTGEGINFNSDFLNGLETKVATEKIIEWLEKNNFGRKKKNYKLHDWVFSRQHYWGEPIPIILCQKCGTVPVPEKDLPVVLPMVERYEPTDTGESPLAKIDSWVNVVCPKCGGEAKRETDTMPNWAGSSWFFLRYIDPKNTEKLADFAKLKYWLPVDWYSGGPEHINLHLLYSRFWQHFLFDIGVVPAPEPYQKRVLHGMILGSGGVKMSKSKGNVINPDGLVEKYGADAFRTYIMFIGPFDQAIPWDEKGLIGVSRFLEKIWKIFIENYQTKIVDEENLEVLKLTHKTIKKVSLDIESMKFNTAISQIMILVNKLNEQKSVSKKTLENLILLLACFAPHLCEEMWAMLEHMDFVSLSSWPQYEESLTHDQEVELPVQINGKLREKFLVDKDISEEDLRDLIFQSAKIKKWILGKEVKKFIYIKGKMVSVVISE